MNEMVEAVKEAKPVLRTLMAFALYLRFNFKIDTSYSEADRFLAILEQDAAAQPNDKS